MVQLVDVSRSPARHFDSNRRRNRGGRGGVLAARRQASPAGRGFELR
jgi:hypothetical protein